jgi:C_GCAxxG_C_C family probable redox protein
MTRYEIAMQTHRAGFNCCAAQLFAWRDRLGLTEQQCYGLSSGMGGGLRTGEICGAVSGAVMALGMLVPHDDKTLAEGKARNAALTKEFQRRFAERFGAVCCRDLKEKETKYTSEAVSLCGAETSCDKYIVAAVEILEEILKEEGI